MALDHYVLSEGKKLRCGYTTGTCAALAATAAACRLLEGAWPETVSLVTPRGIEVTVTPEGEAFDGETASCSVRKDGGDDIDATHGTPICAHVRRLPAPGIVIDGGKGIGRVTRPGLDQPVGNAAINSVPRKMIEASVRKILEKSGAPGGLEIIISAPEGEEIAKKTFNPNLGILGGISILGTSGIVVPMSLQALSDSMRLELRQTRALGSHRVVLVPGNYGTDFLASGSLDIGSAPVVRISNFFGDALDECATLGFRDVLIVGHIGKAVKLAGGIMNTHSRMADCRAELFCAHAALCGASREVCAALMECATTDACIDLLKTTPWYDSVMASLLQACRNHLMRRTGGAFSPGLVLFSNVHGILGITTEAKEMLAAWQAENSMA